MNLIICCTPLQVLIAERIIERYPNERFFGVMLHTVENPKFDYYKQRLKAKTVGFFSLVQHNDRVNLFKEILKLKKVFGGKSFDRVFLANFTELHIQFLLSAIAFKQLNTFDDGTVNIVKNSYLLNDDPSTFMRRLTNLILGNRYSSQKIRSLSYAHYTIYHGMQNIIANTVNLDLLDEHNIPPLASDETVNILLGQPVYADDNQNIALAEKVIKQFDIHCYLPHPREKYKLNDVRYIDTPLIFEDYIMRECSNKKCRIYTYFSSAILNVMNKSPYIEVVALRIDVNEPSYLSCYELFEQLGINVIDIRE